MKRAALISGLCLATAMAVAQDSMVFTSPAHGVSFLYPKTWKFSLKRTHAELTFPVLEGASEAKLMILEAGFRASQDEWQTMQSDVVKAQKRTLVKQWDEIFLGVPMLYTHSEYEDRGFTMASLSGLLYAHANPKFQIRLEVPKPGYEEAETRVRAILLTMRTVTGADFEIENPAKVMPNRKPIKERPFVTKEPKAEPVRPATQITFRPETAPARPETGSQSAATMLAGSPANLLFANGWSAQASESEVVLSHPKLVGKLTVSLHSVVTSPTPGRMLSDQMANDLREFDKVDLRRDAAASYNRAGYSVLRASRLGQKAGAAAMSFVAVGTKDDRYWVLNYRGAASEGKKALELIESLIRTLALEVKA